MKMMPKMMVRSPTTRTPLDPSGPVVVVISSLPSPAAGRGLRPDRAPQLMPERPNATTLATIVPITPESVCRAARLIRQSAPGSSPGRIPARPRRERRPTRMRAVSTGCARASPTAGTVRREAHDRVGHRVVVGHEEPVDAVLDELRHPRPASRDDQQAGGPGLERGDPERLELGRREEHVRVAYAARTCGRVRRPRRSTTSSSPGDARPPPRWPGRDRADDRELHAHPRAAGGRPSPTSSMSGTARLRGTSRIVATSRSGPVRRAAVGSAGPRRPGRCRSAGPTPPHRTRRGRGKPPRC